jgi:Domain of unknown function (DUF4249)
MGATMYFIKSSSTSLILFILLPSCCFLMACSQAIDLNLPVYEPKMVIEFYLEDKQPLRCLLQESVTYTDITPSQLIDDALVVLSHQGKNDTLTNQRLVDRKMGKAYNYANTKIFQAQLDVVYELYIKDKRGREMRGETKFLRAIPIDSVVYKLKEDSVSAGMLFKDPAQEVNYYRLVAYPEREIIREQDTWDISLRDLIFNGQSFSFFTGYSFAKGDTIVGRLYNLTADHFEFSESVQHAQRANGNPFAQPANIRSNVVGGLGIFTAITFDEQRLVIP